MEKILWSNEELKKFNLNKKKLTRLVTKLLECSDLMRELDVSVYGESGLGHLIHRLRPEHDDNGKPDMGAIIAYVGQGFDGGAW